MSPDLDALVRKSARLDQQIDTLHRKSRQLESETKDGSWHPSFDLYHHGDFLFVDLELPGVPAEAMRVDVNPGLVTVCGEKPSLGDLPGREAVISGRRYGTFRSQFALPAGQAVRDLEQRLENGVLHLKIQLAPHPPELQP